MVEGSIDKEGERAIDVIKNAVTRKRRP